MLVLVTLWMTFFSIHSPAIAESVATPSSTVQTAPVIIDGEVLFLVRGVTSYPANERAAAIEDRIKALATDTKFDPDSIQIIEVSEERIDIKAGDLVIVAVLDVDAALESLPSKILAETYRNRLIAATRAYRHDRETSVLMLHAGYALLATLVLAGLIYGMRWLLRQFDRILEKQLQRHIKKLESKSRNIVRSEQVWYVLRTLVEWTRVLLIAIFLYVYFNSVLGLFPWTRAIAQQLFGLILDPLKTIGTAMIDFLPSLLFLVILTFVVRYILKVTRMFFSAVEYGRMHFAGFDAEWADPTYRIVRIVIIALSLVVAYPYIPGSSSEAFKGVSLFFGVLLSLGSSSVISNIIAGYTMTYRRAFKDGDRIRIGDTVGTVTARRVLVTHLRTSKNEEAVIPNSLVLNSEIINYSTLARRDGLIMHTTVGIGYEVPWRQVEAMLLIAAERTTGLRTDKQPFVQQTLLGDYAVTYELNVYCDQVDRIIDLYSELHRNIQDVFNEYGVQIMTPSYESDTPDAKIVPKSKWFSAPARAPAADEM
jgi:small-conductance mechanosensitive channel